MTNKPLDCIGFTDYKIGKTDSFVYNPSDFLPKIEFKKFEGASEYVPFRIEHIIDEAIGLSVVEIFGVTNNTKYFQCGSLDDAEWLMSELNRED